MSSPPTSSTSHKADQLSRSRLSRRFQLHSSTLPVVTTTLNLFRKKPIPNSDSVASVEPFEVYPGILNTDATARVFGYVDRYNNKTAAPPPENKSRRKRKPHEPRYHTNSASPTRSLSPARRLLQRYREVHADDGTDDFRNRTHRQHIEARIRKRQARRDDAKWQIEESERRSRRGRMRTVPRDDELTIRGANPRTGVVTPYVACEGSEDSGYGSAGGYVEVKSQARSSSGKWRQDEGGWVLDEGSGCALVSNSMRKAVEENFVVKMPAMDDPLPASMTNQRNRKYQKGAERAPKTGFFHHQMAPMPRLGTPLRRSSPPTKMLRIKRKEIGSGPGPRHSSGDTIILRNQVRSSSVPTPCKEQKDPRTKMLEKARQCYSSTPRENAIHGRGDGSFLGQMSNTTRQQYSSPPRNRSQEVTPIPKQINAVQGSNLNSSAVFSDHLPAKQSLRDWLPLPSFPHPSQFSNLPASYRRPSEMLPSHLETQAYQAARAACIATTISTSAASQDQMAKHSRPMVQRQEGSQCVPRAGHRQEDTKSAYTCRSPNSGVTSTNRVRGSEGTNIVPTRKVDRCLRPPMRVSNNHALMEKSNKTARELQEQPLISQMQETYIGWVTTDSVAPYPVTPPPQESRLNSRNEMKSIRGPAYSCEGCQSFQPVNVGRMVEGQNAESKNTARSVEKKPKRKSGGKANEITDVEREGEGEDTSTSQDLIDGAFSWIGLTPIPKPSSIGKGILLRLVFMTRHVLSTFNPSSGAFKVLQSPKASGESKLKAVKGLVLAGFYLLVLLNIMLLLRKAGVLVVLLLRYCWLPISAVLVLMRWCMLA
ncbi:hypothetical protein MMC09_000867 [Bachmanniomyces sp. S44760]|nr:hypothetical protein [Bachmanniomyces sp. S44760]